MTTAPHRLRYQGGNQAVHHVPRDRYGRAAIVEAPTYAIYAGWRSEDDAEREVQASGLATVDAALSDLAGDAGPSESDPKRIPVEDESDFVAGRNYLLAEGTLVQIVTCESTDTGFVRTRQEIRHPFTTAATLAGVEISGTFPSAAAADEDDLRSGGGPYLVVWSYEIADVDYFPFEEAWVTRYTTQPIITTDYLELHWPEVSSMMSSRWNPEDLIAAATDELLADIEAAGRDPHGLQHQRVLQLCAVELCVEKAHRQAKSENALEIANEYRTRYDRRLRDLLTGRAPARTAEVAQSTNTASQGGSKAYGVPILRRS